MPTAANAINVSTGGVIAFDGTATFNSRTITAGTGITVTNGSGVSGNPTIAASGMGLTWTDNSGTFTAVANHGYFITATATPTLPASPSAGDTVAFAIDAAAVATVTGNTGQTIRVGAAVSASAGTCANAVRGDSITLVYRATDTSWLSVGAPQGTWTVT